MKYALVLVTRKMMVKHELSPHAPRRASVRRRRCRAGPGDRGRAGVAGGAVTWQFALGMALGLLVAWVVFTLTLERKDK